eukprot:768766-Hanusia_phi.AAC.6
MSDRQEPLKQEGDYAAEGQQSRAPTFSIQPDDSAEIQQGRPPQMGGPANFDTDAYPSKVTSFAYGGSAEASNRTFAVTVSGRTFLFGLHQPVYRDMEDKTAQIFKFLNMICALLMIACGIYRFFASFSGRMVVESCDAPKLAALQNTCNNSITDITCGLVKDVIKIPADGFQIFIVSCFIIFFGVVIFIDEVRSDLVSWILQYVDAVNNILGRGLYLLLLSSIVMTSSHTFLLYTSLGERVGIHHYNQHSGPSSDSENKDNIYTVAA